MVISMITKRTYYSKQPTEYQYDLLIPEKEKRNKGSIILDKGQ